jgi:predicted esterase
MRRRRIASVAGVVCLLVAGLTAAPADATVLKFEPFEGTDSYNYSDCGYPVHVESEFEGSEHLRIGKNRDQSVYFLLQHFSFREVHTNTLTGEWFVVRGHSSFHEVKATHVEGSIYEITQLQVGQPFVVEDSSGRVVVRDRGAIRFSILFDTGGDNVPGGEFVDFLGFEVRGPHPGFFTNFCAIEGDLIGFTDSSDRYTLHPTGATASPLGYSEYLPPDYADEGTSPLLVFLHGSGESGDGSAEQLELLSSTAIPAYIAFDGWPGDRPFVVLAPQHEQAGNLEPYSACDGVEFGGSCALTLQHDLGHPNPGSICFTPDEVRAFLAYAIDAYDVDPHRVYLTGLSCGGFGAWEYLAKYGDEQVAAVVPVAGEGRPAFATAGCELGDVPIWAFHGLADDVVSPAGSIEPIEGLQACTSPPPVDARLTTYSDVGHDSWTNTYAVGAENDIYAWMLGISHP